MQKFIINNLLIFSILFSFIFNIIIFPFETYSPLISKNKKLLELLKNASDEEIIETILINLIYTKFEIGDKIQTIPTFIEMNSNEFYINDLKMKDIIPYNKDMIYKNFTYNDNYLLNNIFLLNYYNSSLSQSYKYITTCPEYLAEFFLDRDYCANDTIYLAFKKNITDKEIKKQITFYISFKGFDKLDHRPGMIGLDINNSDLILKLKQYSQIEKYIWSIKYNNNIEEKGELIIGDFPHIYDSNNYNEDNLRNAKVIKLKYFSWRINFDDVYLTTFNKNKKEYFYLQKNEIAIFSIEEFFIVGTNEYFKMIEETFFKKYIEEGICKKKRHNKPGQYNFYFYFICYIKNKNKKEELINIFPSLTFYQKEMNYNFTLDSKDLFTIFPDDNRILFNIEFSYGSDEWILGKPFFKKYQLVFNPDSKLISYYDNENSEKKLNLKEDHNSKIIIIIFLIIVAFIVGIIFGRIICTKYNRKIRANELEDNYSYISKNNNMINMNLKKENFKSDYKNIN